MDKVESGRLPESGTSRDFYEGYYFACAVNGTDASLTAAEESNCGLKLPSVKKRAKRFGLHPETEHALILTFWAVLISVVVIGSLAPAGSSLMVAVGRLHINDKIQHFCAYLALSSVAVIGFPDRRRGIIAGLSMFLLGILLEGGQHFSPGRAVELGDVVANGAGVSCGTMLGLPIRMLIAIL
jgi:hypothetical protein